MSVNIICPGRIPPLSACWERPEIMDRWMDERAPELAETSENGFMNSTTPPQLFLWSLRSPSNSPLPRRNSWLTSQSEPPQSFLLVYFSVLKPIPLSAALCCRSNSPQLPSVDLTTLNPHRVTVLHPLEGVSSLSAWLTNPGFVLSQRGLHLPHNIPIVWLPPKRALYHTESVLGKCCHPKNLT